jgi:hypothetical protein
MMPVIFVIGQLLQKTAIIPGEILFVTGFFGNCRPLCANGNIPMAGREPGTRVQVAVSCYAGNTKGVICPVYANKFTFAFLNNLHAKGYVGF